MKGLQTQENPWIRARRSEAASSPKEDFSAPEHPRARAVRRFLGCSRREYRAFVLFSQAIFLPFGLALGVGIPLALLFARGDLLAVPFAVAWIIGTWFASRRAVVATKLLFSQDVIRYVLVAGAGAYTLVAAVILLSFLLSRGGSGVFFALSGLAAVITPWIGVAPEVSPRRWAEALAIAEPYTRPVLASIARSRRELRFRFPSRSAIMRA